MRLGDAGRMTVTGIAHAPLDAACRDRNHKPANGDQARKR